MRKQHILRGSTNVVYFHEKEQLHDSNLQEPNTASPRRVVTKPKYLRDYIT